MKITWDDQRSILYGLEFASSFQTLPLLTRDGLKFVSLMEQAIHLSVVAVGIGFINLLFGFSQHGIGA